MKMHQAKNHIKKALCGNISVQEQVKAINAAGHKYYYTPQQRFDDINKKMVIDEMRQFIKPGKILELGYTNDIWTKALLNAGNSEVDIIEVADNHVATARKKFANNKRVKVFKTLFEDYKPKVKYDTILMAGVIKHVPDDVGFLKMSASWLKPDGVVIATTPNSRSFHRRLGAYMGLEDSPIEHNRRDTEIFNVHLYDRYQWRSIFLKAGYDVIKSKGVYFKTLSTDQMMYLGKKFDIIQIMNGLKCLGEELQDYAWYLLLVARLPKKK